MCNAFRCIAHDKHTCAMNWDCIAYVIRIVVQCIGIALLMISIVVQCNGDKHGCAMYRDCIAYDKHRCAMLEN